MKKTAFGILCLLLAGCESTGTGTSIGNTMIRNWVDTQCRTELNSRAEWQLITVLMNDTTKNTWENNICGCASEEAPKYISSSEMSDLLTTEGRTKIIGEVTIKTVGACIKRLGTTVTANN